MIGLNDSVSAVKFVTGQNMPNGLNAMKFSQNINYFDQR